MTIKKYQTDLNKAIGKPYSQQPGRKRGKGRGKIVSLNVPDKLVSLKEYETADGNFITVYTLTPEGFLEEKINTYLNRMKIRDLYDIFFLLRYANKDQSIKDKVKKFAVNFKKPIDEKDLKILILEGLVPETEKMVQYIKNWS